MAHRQEIMTFQRRGRPFVSEARSSVSTWIPARYHDRLIRIAQRNEVSVSAVVRGAIVLLLKDESSGPSQD